MQGPSSIIASEDTNRHLRSGCAALFPLLSPEGLSLSCLLIHSCRTASKALPMASFCFRATASRPAQEINTCKFLFSYVLVVMGMKSGDPVRNLGKENQAQLTRLGTPSRIITVNNMRSLSFYHN